MAYPRTNRSNLVITAGSTIVAATLSVDNTSSGASGPSLEIRGVEVNHLWRCANRGASCELSCEDNYKILDKHFGCEIGS